MPRQAGEGKAAIAIRESENKKLGRVSATMASLHSCGECPFRNNGCYAQDGHVGMIVRRMDRHVAESEVDEIAIAQAEADGIDAIWSGLPLRVHVSGDCKSNETARIVAGAAERYMERNGQPAWGYTHAWRVVDRESWGRVSMLASVENEVDAELARQRGYAPAMVTDEFQNGRKPWRSGNGLTIMPCPEMTGSSPTCTSCRLCWKDEDLLARRQVIAFEAHGSNRKKVKLALQAH